MAAGLAVGVAGMEAAAEVTEVVVAVEAAVAVVVAEIGVVTAEEIAVTEVTAGRTGICQTACNVAVESFRRVRAILFLDLRVRAVPATR